MSTAYTSVLVAMESGLVAMGAVTVSFVSPAADR